MNTFEMLYLALVVAVFLGFASPSLTIRTGRYFQSWRRRLADARYGTAPSKRVYPCGLCR